MEAYKQYKWSPLSLLHFLEFSQITLPENVKFIAIFITRCLLEDLLRNLFQKF